MDLKFGSIPEEWESTTLGGVCGRITTGKLDANAMVADGDFPFFTCARENYWIDKYAFDYEALLVSGNGANVGYVHYYDGKFNAYQRTYVISEFSADVQFLKLFLERNLHERIRVEVNAGNTPYITMGTLTEMEVVLPRSRDEQRAIATALSDMDGLLGGLDRLIAKKRDLKQAAMQQLLTGQTRLPGFHGEWEVKRLRDLFEITSSKRVFQSEWKSEGIPFYRARELAVLGETGQVDNELFITKSLYDSFRTAYGVPEVGDMLVTGVGTLGKVYVVRDEEEFYFKDGNIIWFKIRGAVSAEFLRQLYLTKVVMKQIIDGSAGTTVGTYTISGAKKTEIPFPPLPEQTAIAAVLTEMDGELARLEQRREKTRALKQAMMQELLTGRTRLV